MAWNGDGVILFSRRDGLWKVLASGGNAVQVTTYDASLQQDLNGAPQFLPDGRHFLFFGRSAQAGKSAVYIGSIDSSREKNRALVFPATSSAVYAQDAQGAAYLLFQREGALMAQPFDVARFKLTGEPFLAASEVALAGSALAVSVSHNGVLVLSSDTNPGLNTQLAWFTRDGKPLSNAAPTDRYQDFSLAPDGKRMAVALHNDLWLLDLTTSGLTHFTFDPATDRFPVWSPDGTRIVYTRALAYLYEKMVDGTGEHPLMGVLGRPMDWSTDGRSILVRGNDGIFGPSGMGSPSHKRRSTRPCSILAGRKLDRLCVR